MEVDSMRLKILLKKIDFCEKCKTKLRHETPPKTFYIHFYYTQKPWIPKPGLGSTQHGPGGVRSANGPRTVRERSANGPRTDRSVPSRKAYESYNPHPNPVLFTAHVAAPTTSRNTRANILPQVFSVFGSPCTKKSKASQKNIFPQVFSVFSTFFFAFCSDGCCNRKFTEVPTEWATRWELEEMM